MRSHRIVALSFVGLAACGGGLRHTVSSAIDAHDVPGAMSAYDRLRASDGDDAGLLTQIAELLLVTEAASDDASRRTAALDQLGLAGTAGRSALDRLARGGSVQAMAVLAQAGDGSARSALRAHVDDADPDVRAAAVLGLSVEGDRARILALAAEPSARVRSAAVARLGELAPESEARGVLEERARIDPDPSVRGAAVRALGSFGVAAVELLRERLSDPIASVRMAAVAALLHADRDAGRASLASLLATPPSVQGIEAARLLATPIERDQPPTDEDASSARAYLTGALAASDGTLRGQAAVALSTLPRTAETPTVLRQALAREADPSVRLQIARTLASVPGAEDEALAAIRALADADASMTSLQAAIVLAIRHDEAGIARVEQALHAGDVPLRRAAARAIARDAMLPERAASALEDDDASVRIQAAGGILAAAAANE